MARREKYNTHIKPHLEDITNWIADGETEYSIHRKLGVNHDTWYRYKNKKSELSEAIKKGQQNLSLNLESLLYRKCKGYEVEETKTYIQKIGDKETKKVEKLKKHIPSSDTALIFALKNTNPEKWKDKQEIQQDINAKLENIVIDIEEDED